MDRRAFIVAAVLSKDPALSIGPVFIANILNWMLLGTLIMQVYTYYTRHTMDHTWIRILVAFLLCIDITQTFLLTSHGWFFIVTIWGNVARMDEIPWTADMIPIMGGLASLIVQIFYAWRIWRLSQHKVLHVLAVLIVMLALMQGISAIVSGIILLQRPSQATLIRLAPGFTLQHVGSFITDIIITASMSYILYKAKSRARYVESETMLAKLINNTVQTGAVTVAATAVDVVLLRLYVNTTYHHVPAYILGKLYSNSLMLNLNRRQLSEFSGGTESQSDSTRMRNLRTQKSSRSRDLESIGVVSGTRPELSPALSTPKYDLADDEHDIVDVRSHDPTNSVKWDEEGGATLNIQVQTSVRRDEM